MKRREGFFIIIFYHVTNVHTVLSFKLKLLLFVFYCHYFSVGLYWEACHYTWIDCWRAWRQIRASAAVSQAWKVSRSYLRTCIYIYIPYGQKISCSQGFLRHQQRKNQLNREHSHRKIVLIFRLRIYKPAKHFAHKGIYGAWKWNVIEIDLVITVQLTTYQRAIYRQLKILCFTTCNQKLNIFDLF